MIYILGLGSGDKYSIKESLKNKIKELSKSSQVVVRTEAHPAVQFLKDNKINFYSCDEVYKENNNFYETYKKITDYILDNAKRSDVLYLVPGHPMVAELTTKLILSKTDDVQVIGGESFLDLCFNVAKFDPIEGFNFLDATDIECLKEVNPKLHTIITQCYDDLTAGNISLELGEYFPINHKVVVMENLSNDNERVYETTLEDLQTSVGEKINNLRAIYLPPYKECPNYNLKKLVPEFKENITNEKLINNILSELRKIEDNTDDKDVESSLSKILFNTLNFINSEDGYYNLENILKEYKENNG